MVGKKIKHFRTVKNLKRQWLAEQIGISEAQVNRIENDKCDVTTRKLFKIAKVLNVSIIDLIDEEFLNIGKVINYEKYGPVESSFIRFVIYQNEMLHMKYGQLLKTNNDLVAHLNNLTRNVDSLLHHLKTQPAVNGTKK
jgi:transcriptional regulator with XRE-family HTH domain